MKKIKGLLSTGFLAAMLALSHSARADENGCSVTSDPREIDYGYFRMDEMRAGSVSFEGATIPWYAANPRQFTITVACPSDRKQRLFIDGVFRRASLFRFSDMGGFRLQVTSATLDGQRVMLSTVQRGTAAPTRLSGTDKLLVSQGYGIAAVDGQELAGKILNVTVEISTYLSPKAFGPKDAGEYVEMLHVDFETLAP